MKLKINSLFKRPSMPIRQESIKRSINSVPLVIRFNSIFFANHKDLTNFLTKEEITHCVNTFFYDKLLAAAVARHMRLATKLTNHLNKEPEDDNQNL